MTGPSMAPALRHGDQILVWRGSASRRLRPGQIVMVELPGAPLAVKRVTSVQEDGAVWLEGDNPFGSTDSRQLGAVDPSLVRGRVLVRLWPRPGPIPARRPAPGHDGASH